MNKQTTSAIVIALVGCVLGVVGIVNKPAPESNTAEIEALQKRIDNLQAEMGALLKSAKVSAANSEAIDQRVTELREMLNDIDATVVTPEQVQIAMRKMWEDRRKAFDNNRNRDNIEIADIPAKVKELALKEFPEIEFTRARSREKDNKKYFDLDGKVDGRDVDMKISPEGELIEKGEDMKFEELAEKIQKKTRELVPEFRVRKIEKETTKKGVIYDVELYAGHTRHTLEFNADGELVDHEKRNFNRRGGGRGGRPQQKNNEIKKEERAEPEVF